MARQFMLQTDDDPTLDQMQIPYAEELNAQQLDVVTFGTGASLVVAGAGTGKTRTLIYRVAYLVESGVAPEQIVLLTFTRRAANEMLNRASGLLDGRCRRVRGGTFHAFCLRILKQYASKLGFPNNFTMLDASDSADVIDVVKTSSGAESKEKRFPRKRTIQSIISSARNKGRSIQDVVEVSYPQFVDFTPQIETIFEAYETYKKVHGLMDYDDLLLYTLKLFSQEPGVLREVASQNRHVLVDEFQDTNRAQAKLVKAFSSVFGNVMAVGDDAQSIYRFRGADFQNILSFPDEYVGTQILRLEHNYRSTQHILDLANHLLDSAKRKYEKRLFTDRAEGDLPALVPAPDDRFESRFVSQMILQFRDQGIPLNEMAVLFRNGHNSYDLEVELNKKNIPFVKFGGLKLAEAAHVKDILAHLKVVENPQDAIAWNRILQLLEGVGPKTAGRIIDWVESNGGDQFILEERPFSASYIGSLRALFSTLRAVKKGEASCAEQLEIILEYYAPILRRVYYEDYPKREQDLEHFVGLSHTFTDRGNMLSSLALDPIELTAIGQQPEADDEPPLVLSTIHSAKGLEFKVVFLIHALDGVIPSGYSVGDAEAVEEELRLLYVAVTRAADQLFISYPMVQFRQFDGQYFANPSRFLANISSDLLEPCTLVEQTENVLPASDTIQQIADGSPNDADTANLPF
ncbi:MAG: ATP-dependent helicase [Bacteroidetes Order II. Incertae sedis bacterium]|jgi:DNA helicase II / ATP-dependent DNA helicase PcrA|nr:ATP-dependent helicase [Bacteroidetes Order II. bacterium]MBT4051634.1 ATP-dependent helicase [Bacteroidetes Order II. bacterium]MBT4602582.1 ATP-dependent helicase [Bacteroidetes Order II. bacterium]MBT5248772.1 ATP-dependent helicase [Bacteroidetes Order II. bacterium]MBT6200031.1 ATP-dependent helicase [Bacteroidetes Order II. bacterium]